MPGTNPDAAEAWVHDPLTLEALLKRLAVYRKVIVLSGDVHYAYSGGASYWRKRDATPARFAQFTSSGLKNVWPHQVVTFSRSFAFAQAIERLANPVELLGWDAELARSARRSRRRRAAPARPRPAAAHTGAAPAATAGRTGLPRLVRRTGRGGSV